MRNSSLLCFLSGVCRGTCWQLPVWLCQHRLSPQLLPWGCGTWQGVQGGCCFFRCFGSKPEVCPSTPGGEKMHSDLCAAPSTVQAGWALCRLSIQGVARQVRAHLLLTKMPFWACPTSWCQ